MARIPDRKPKPAAGHTRKGRVRRGRASSPPSKRGGSKAAASPARPTAQAAPEHAKEHVPIRPARAADIPQVTALDERITGIAKSDYWQHVFERYSRHHPKDRFFLVAAGSGAGGAQQILGFIIGEIRVWEFGSAPCGWVFALSVEPDARLHGVGQALFAAMSAHFTAAGVTKMRTMVARDNPLHMVFFRGEGMMAGPYIQLEKELT
jgi:ribosomal protein S18 acetylase RimI-like enzyme